MPPQQEITSQNRGSPSSCKNRIFCWDKRNTIIKSQETEKTTGLSSVFFLNEYVQVWRGACPKVSISFGIRNVPDRLRALQEVFSCNLTTLANECVSLSPLLPRSISVHFVQYFPGFYPDIFSSNQGSKLLSVSNSLNKNCPLANLSFCMLVTTPESCLCNCTQVRRILKPDPCSQLAILEFCDPEGGILALGARLFIRSVCSFLGFFSFPPLLLPVQRFFVCFVNIRPFKHQHHTSPSPQSTVFSLTNITIIFMRFLKKMLPNHWNIRTHALGVLSSCAFAGTLKPDFWYIFF